KNKALGKKDLVAIIDQCFKELGQYKTVILLDEIKNLGYKYATLAGVSISIDAMKVPPEKDGMVKEAKKQIREIEKQAKLGLITESERYNKIIDIWTKVTDNVADIMFDEMKKDEGEVYKPNKNRFNSVFMMADSGARGSRQQVRQLAGMRGLMAKPQKKLSGGVGEIIETPIIANFREGLSILEYFISTHGGRKGLSDTALKTAEAGYLTRKLVDVSHDVVVTEHDCHTPNGVFIGDLKSGEETIEKIDERIVGRVALDNVVGIIQHGDDIQEELIVKRGEVITLEQAKKLIEAGIDKIGIRSVLTCEAEHGVCAKCYGLSPATGKLAEVGEAVGVVAAQSIGEPGTQLTLRTFHIGGAASTVTQKSEIYAEKDGTVDFYNLKSIKNRDGDILVVNRNTELVFTENSPRRRQVHKIPYGAVIKVKDGQEITLKDGKHVLLAKWDPHSKSIISEYDGKLKYVDIKDGVTLQKEKSKITGQIERVIIEDRTRKNRPKLVIEKDGKSVIEYPLTIGTTLVAPNGSLIKMGD
ncbi:MAG: DNA-directed RNA polymerase subunit beta', partial [Elusimicrobia bacterium]|nr:DNA-directed RNA polymerase subunit beta' [Elusimicrobiota bacterium]